MTTTRKALPFVLLAVVALWTFSPHGPNLTHSVYAQANDCAPPPFTFTGDATLATVSNLSKNTPCVNWRVTLSTTGTLTSTVTFQTSPDASVWTAVPNTLCAAVVQPPCIFQGSNPIVGTQGMVYAAAYGSYVRIVITSSSGTGTGTIRMYGAKGATANNSVSNGAGSGTVTNVSFTGGLISVANPTTAPALTVAGTSGGISYFSSASTWASSGLLTAGQFVLGGGAGLAPATSFSVVPLLNGGTGATTLAGAGIATGTGALNVIPKWSNTTGGLMNSSISDNGTLVSIISPININLGNFSVQSTNNDSAGISFQTVFGGGGSASKRQWQIANNVNSAGTLEFLQSATSTGPTTNIVLTMGRVGALGYGLDVTTGVGNGGTARFFDQTATTGLTLVTITPGAAQTAASVTMANGGSETIAGALAVTGAINGSNDIRVGTANYLFWQNRTHLFSPSDGVLLLQNNSTTSFTRLDFGSATNSTSAIASGIINGFAIQSAAGTSTFNDAVTAGSGTVAQRHLFFIDAPTLTATNTLVTYTNTATMHLGLPVAGTNVTFTNPAVTLLSDGPININNASFIFNGHTCTIVATVVTCP